MKWAKILINSTFMIIFQINRHYIISLIETASLNKQTNKQT
jgi:hypothetical protein